MFLREIAKVALCQWALDAIIQAQMEVAVAQMAEEAALVAAAVVLAAAELAAAGKICLP